MIFFIKLDFLNIFGFRYDSYSFGGNFKHSTILKKENRRETNIQN